jgi:hypothetical protein
MVGADGRPSRDVDRQRDVVADLDGALLDAADKDDGQGSAAADVGLGMASK